MKKIARFCTKQQVKIKSEVGMELRIIQINLFLATTIKKHKLKIL